MTQCIPDQVPPAAAVEVGIGRRDITPPVGIYARNWGAAKHDVAEGIHRPLTATAMVMRENPKAPPLLLVTLDAGWWQQAEDEWRVRGAVIQSLGLQSDRVMIACTHTHAGPSLCTADAGKPGGEHVAPYIDTIRDAVVSATQEALANARPSTLTWGVGHCDLATNRDLRDPACDRVICGYNPDATADPTVLVGRVTNNCGRVRATIVNYACHATTLAWDNNLISPDYVGAMREVVEHNTANAPCLFLQGASGELSPREQYTGAAAVADANGRRLGLAALAALEAMLPPRMALAYAGAVESGAPLATWQRQPFNPPSAVAAACIDVELPLKPLPSQDEVQRQLDTCTDRTIAERLRRKLRVIRSVGSGPTCRMPLWIWRVGRSLFVGQPNEAYSLLQIALRRSFPDHALVVMNLVNGSCGYLSPPDLYDQDVYQVWQSPFDRGALPVLIESAERKIRQMLALV